MKSVWAVEDGAYSDFHIEAIFSTKKKAEEYAVACCPTGDVTKYDLDQFDRQISLHARGFFGWTVTVYRYGQFAGRSNARKMAIPGVSDWDKTIRFYPWQPEYMELRVVAKTEQGAIKIAKEKERQAIAEGWWGDKHQQPGVPWDCFSELGE